MKRLITAVLGVFLAASCGGEGEPPAANNPAAGNRAANIPAAVSNTGVSNGAQPSGNVAAANGPAALNPQVAGRNRKLDQIRQAGSDPNVPKADIEALLKQSARPAPEDSEFSVALTNILVERRRFLKHPILAQVDKVTEGERSSIKVTMRDGRAVEIPGKAIEKLSVASTGSILKAAGLERAPSLPLDRKPSANRKD